MAKEQEKEIINKIQNILRSSHTASELAESYLNNRPPAGVTSSDLHEIIQELSEFDMLREKHDLLQEIAEAYFHFSARILYEDGFFSNRQIQDMLLSSDQISSRIDDSINAYELLSNVPVSVNANSVLIARNNLMHITQDPVCLESCQLTELQLLCLMVPEAINEVIRLMGERPFVRMENKCDKPYLQAFIRVLHARIENALPTEQDKGRAAGSEPQALIAGILTTFYHEYLSFPSEDYLIDLVNRSI